MRAILRVTRTLAAAALAFAPAVALAQAAPTTNGASSDTIGPAELQNFSLKGTVTRPADQPAAAAAVPTRPPAAAPTTAPLPRKAVEVRAPDRTVSAAPASTIAAPPPAVTRQPPAAAPAPAPVASPPAEGLPAQTVAPAPTPLTAAPAAAPSSQPGDPFAGFRGLPLWPWIAAALALVAGAAFLLWRRWPRQMAIAGPQFDLLVRASPEPEPEPKPKPKPEPQPLPRAAAPAPPPRRAPAASGIVASRLRPALELGFHPLRCQIDDDQVAIEFELELFNAGAAPARAVLAEASLLNAGETQENDLAAFFSKPNGVGERLSLIPPMKRVSFRSQVVAPRAAVQEYELAGRKAFVPVIAFNALYEWSGGKAQSSAAYLVGRDTQQDKLGPLRLDQGAREFRELGARPLPSGVRT